MKKESKLETRNSKPGTVLLVGVVLGLGAVLLGSSQGAYAQMPPPREPLEERRPPLPPQRPLLRWFEQMAQLPPAERMAALERDARFQRLPPERQRRLRERLEWFGSLPPERRRLMLERVRRLEAMPPLERHRLRRRAQVFGALTPQQRRQAQRIFRAWQQLPPERRELLRERIERLRELAPAERRPLLDDPAFLEPLRPMERRLFFGVLRLARPLPGRELPATGPENP